MNELKTWENLIEAFRLYREDIYTFIYFKSNRKRDFAEDITQETFEKAWLRKNLFKGGNLKNWLFQIAINTAKDSYKKTNRETQMPEDLESTDSETDLYKHYIAKSLEQMKSKEQELVILHYILGYSYNEIANIFKTSEGSIRVAVFRAFEKLKAIANGKIK